ncbi:uncharacterized protein [Rutidosis leptorrhynchoides]|uniref:uncharacterized protein n=1 Tax=Rutidosis leptorrhynchoides TaxID=125765 RepID=UPI003A99EE9F
MATETLNIEAYIEGLSESIKPGGNARGRAFNISAQEAEEDPNLVTGTFLINNLLVCVLFDSGADVIFVSSKLSPKIITPLSSLDTKYTVEVSNGKVLKVENVYRNCKIILADRSFEVDLIHIKLGCFVIVIGMDWLSKNIGEIVCFDKAISIPRENEEPLLIFRDKKCKHLNFISCLKVQKYLRKGFHAILAHVGKPDQKERHVSDVAIVKDFPKVFTEDFPGLPPHREVEFQIDLAPGVTPAAHAPYRLAPSELQELQPLYSKELSQYLAEIVLVARKDEQCNLLAKLAQKGKVELGDFPEYKDQGLALVDAACAKLVDAELNYVVVGSAYTEAKPAELLQLLADPDGNQP